MSGSRRGGFTLLQLMLAVALAGIVLGMVAGVRNESTVGGHYTAAFSPDGERFVVGYRDGRIALGDTASGRLGRSYAVPRSGITALAFSPDGTTLAVGANSGTVRLWDVQGQREVRALKGPPEASWAVAFSRDGKRVASGGIEGAVVVWEVATGNVQQELNHGEPVSWLVLGVDGLATGSGSYVKIWDLDTGAVRDQYPPKSGWIVAAAVTPNGRTLAVAERDGTVVLYDTATAGQRTILKTGPYPQSIAFLDDGRTLAVNEGGRVAIWDVTDSVQERTLDAPGAWFDRFWVSGDGRRLMASVWPKEIRAWDVKQGTTRSVAVHATPLLSWLLLLGACYLVTLAWIAAIPDLSAHAARLRASITERDLAGRIRWYDRPAALVGLAGGGLAIGVAAAAVAHVAFGDFFVPNDPELRRPFAGVAVGLVVGLGFVGHFRLLLRKLRPLAVEVLPLRSRRRLRWDITRHKMVIAILFLVMVCSAPAAAWVVGVSPLTAVFASFCGIGCLYWEQATTVRAAEARMGARRANA